MSYQVLARKWRPRSFADMVGQEHVVRALSNALDRDQLHHAYLFTGTRGVGKTTLARILSKALNCEQGVSARPCGQCSTCREIDEGRFVDLLEVDAASRTKVDQTRELLDNVPFAPVKGRFKVYLIDEVHMFSAHSFNALLKTLEEPPTHVKFLLATTDPQKVPATVLSRCLQFNLKRLVPEQITDQFARILAAEGIEFEPRALTLLAQAADGSMRDGLSLLDQAIAFGGGRVTGDEVRTMLGTVGRELCLNLLQALAKLDRPGLLDEVARIAELTPDFADVLQELIGLLHRVALYQEVPATLREDDPERERIADLAGQLAPEDIQLFYQIALLGQRDLSLVPDPRTGIEMVLLRMLAFRPDAGDETRTEQRPKRQPTRSPAPPRDVPGESVTPRGERSAGPGAARQSIGAGGAARETQAPVAPPPPAASGEDYRTVERAGDTAPPRVTEAGAETTLSKPYLQEPTSPDSLHSSEDWHRLVADLGLGGVASQLAHNCGLAGWDGHRLALTLAPECQNLRAPSAEERLQDALAGVLGKGLKVEIRISRPEHETPAQRQAHRHTQRRLRAEALMEEDPVARFLQDEFDARWVPGSIEPTP
ncbi:DNA polymerase III subunit gamma/tau [Candidatus Thiosymbion oneisti]|uniref:DNA polymerase III subunit gamma/tau n=1 Tax=Candidatus Thiosymbion oneisti TaxID=589554 RepID=UPI000AA6080F|nr:DNA polymerase III subunit gamma/tau [Candidatus Thiosymbion oneisti]